VLGNVNLLGAAEKENDARFQLLASILGYSKSLFKTQKFCTQRHFREYNARSFLCSTFVLPLAAAASGVSLSFTLCRGFTLRALIDKALYSIAF
jgi:hypothetical protein